MNGFYREIYENQSENTFNYFSENFLKIYKPAYTIDGKDHVGQIKILKSRTIKNPEYIKKGTKYTGGPFLPIGKDLVLKKNWTINPDYSNKFYFELEKITNYDGKQVYVINSTLRDSSGTTKLYINKEDLAYIKIETFNKSKDRGGEYKRIGETSTMLYEQKGDIWFLKYLKYSIDGDKKDEIINHLAEFVATNFETENIKPFSYNEQLLKTDIIADQKSDISDSFFEGQEGIIEQSNALKNQVQLAFKLNVLDSLKNTSSSSSIEQSNIKTKEETAQYKQRQGFDFRTFLLRANLFFPNFGFVYTPIYTYNATFSTTLANTFEKSRNFSATTRSNFVPILYNSKYWTFSLNKRFILQYSKNNTIRNTVYVNQRDIGLAYRIILNKTTKPIFIEPNIKYTIGLSGVNFGLYKNANRDFFIDNKNFSSKEFIAGIFQKSEGIKFGLNTAIYSGKLWVFPAKLYLMADYQHVFKTSEPFFRVKEERFFGFLERKIDLPLHDKRLESSKISITQLPKLTDNLWIGLSYRIVLR